MKSSVFCHFSLLLPWMHSVRFCHWSWLAIWSCAYRYCQILTGMVWSLDVTWVFIPNPTVLLPLSRLLVSMELYLSFEGCLNYSEYICLIAFSDLVCFWGLCRTHWSDNSFSSWSWHSHGLFFMLILQLDCCMLLSVSWVPWTEFQKYFFVFLRHVSGRWITWGCVKASFQEWGNSCMTEVQLLIFLWQRALWWSW